MRELLARFRNCRVLVVGDLMLDEYLSGECSRISPEAPVPVVQVRESKHVLGGAGNTAANIVALGGRVTLVGLLGRDQAGDRLARTAAGLGIELIGLEDGRPTLRKTRVVGQTQQLVRLDYEDTRPIEAPAATRLLDACRERVPLADAVVVSDYAKGLLTHSLCQELIHQARRARVPILVDPRPQHRTFYEHCDYVTPNWKECLGLLGEPEHPATDEHVTRAGRALAERLDCSVVLTLGAQGLAFFPRDGGEAMHLPTDAKEVYDVSGAGDTVAATFALARAAGATHHDALDLANRAAGIVVGKFGTATVTPAELLETDPPGARLVGRDGLAALARSLRAAGKRIVTINGSFDLLHAGHLHIIREASRQGDALIVGLNSDASVRRYKGPSRPLIAEGYRAELLLALRFVDYVHVFDEPDPIAFLEEVRPDVHVNGAEYGAECVEASVVARYGGRLHLVDRIDGLSTTAILEAAGTPAADSRTNSSTTAS
jgi:D-beta-D-heptose 7-phosphate kinase / D-beta-D-heptose 1-phosphate adenosyltransferase